MVESEHSPFTSSRPQGATPVNGILPPAKRWSKLGTKRPTNQRHQTNDTSRGATLLLAFLTLWLLSPLSNAEQTSREYEVKAALLYKLSKFVTWPALQQSSFQICIYGENPFGAAIGQLERRTVQGKSVQVQFLQQVNSRLNHCDLLYISESAVNELRRVLMVASHSSVLTISDIKNFAEFGGMIELASQGQRINFRINLNAVDSVDIRIASTLLELATIVSDG